MGHGFAKMAGDAGSAVLRRQVRWVLVVAAIFLGGRAGAPRMPCLFLHMLEMAGWC